MTNAKTKAMTRNNDQRQRDNDKDKETRTKRQRDRQQPHLSSAAAGCPWLCWIFQLPPVMPFPWSSLSPSTKQSPRPWWCTARKTKTR